MNIKNFFMLTFSLCLFSSNVISGESKIKIIIPNDKYGGQKGKNGINLSDILKNFDRNFTFVSTHYREDKFEIRLIYANKLGMEGLKSKNLKFKDGAIFYKVVFPTLHDPNFDASLVPEAQPIVRQIMVHNKQKYKKYNGWGYAVFTENAETLPGDPDATLDTCYACHQLVEGRNNIFSYPIQTITPNSKIASTHYTKDEVANSKNLSVKLFNFKIESFNSLTSDQKSLVSQKTKEINIMDGDILKMDFSGYMSELSSFLVNKTRENGLPSFAGKSFENQQMFIYSFIDFDSNECKGSDKLIRFGWGRSSSMREKIRYTAMKKCAPVTTPTTVL